MLDKVIYGNTVEDWAISLLIIVSAIVLNKLVAILFKNVIRKITAKSKAVFDDIIVDALEKPLLLGIMLFALWMAIDRLQINPDYLKNINKSFTILIGLNITWLFASFASKLIEEEAEEEKVKKKKGKFYIDSKLFPMIRRAILIIVWMIGLITTLHMVGIELQAIIGALGIGGVAVAFAAQDTLKNIFAGLTILTSSSFRLGEVIKVDATEGTVVDIGIRTTSIRTYDKRLVLIPNYKLTDSVITNISSEPGRRIVMELGLTYDTAPEKMQEALKLLREIPEKIKEVKSKDLIASFTDYKDSSLNITFIYFINKTADIFETRSKVNSEILESFNNAGLNFAFPTSTVYIEK
ncbi:MAG: mechanosensitive ion channel family protein [Tannerella sp.]|jgi:MscS family membrane protein|nr:mechanosensitive ion channel family protein [Tannerella sp.]